MQTINRNGWVFQIQDNGEATLAECMLNAPVITLPAFVNGHPLTEIEHDAFDHAGPCEAFRVEEGHPAFCVIDGVLFDRAGTKLIRYPHQRAADVYEPPAGTQCIGMNAFLGSRWLSCVILPETVREIGARAFAECPQLTDVRLPASLKAFGHEVFRGCSSLKEVWCPDGSPALVREGCFLIDRREGILLTCLPGNGETELEAPADIRFVDEYAFYGCNSLQKIHFHHHLRALGKYAFYHCASLRTVDLPEGLRIIGSRAFSGCTLMRTLYVPDSVTSIEYKAFNNCDRLTLIVNKGSYTDRYCRQFGFPCHHRIQWPWQKEGHS